MSSWMWCQECGASFEYPLHQEWHDRGSKKTPPPWEKPVEVKSDPWLTKRRVVIFGLSVLVGFNLSGFFRHFNSDEVPPRLPHRNPISAPVFHPVDQAGLRTLTQRIADDIARGDRRDVSAASSNAVQLSGCRFVEAHAFLSMKAGLSSAFKQAVESHIQGYYSQGAVTVAYAKSLFTKRGIESALRTDSSLKIRPGYSFHIVVAEFCP